MRATERRGRAGFSLVEMLIALTVFGVILSSALGMMAKQVSSTSSASDASNALQNLRFTFDQVERGLRAAGIGLGDGQPTLVYADSSVIVFNGNYMSNNKNDPASVFVDTMQTDLATTVLPSSRHIRIPGTAIYYPDTTYNEGGKVGSAETILFYFRPDSTTARTDDYILFRQVNDLPPEVVSRDLLHNGTLPFFQYTRVSTPASGLPKLDSIRTAQLPLRHTVKMHLTVGDSGTAAIIDSVRAVRVSFTATNGATAGQRLVLRSISRLLRLPNAGIQEYVTCGNVPIAPTGFTAVAKTIGSSRVVELAWTASSDQNSGEKDVIRYVIYRSISPAPLGDALYTVASGTGTSYVWDDYSVAVGTTYTYAVAAEDCTPNIGSTTALVNATP